MLPTPRQCVDTLERGWDHAVFRRARSASLVLVLVGGVLLIEVGRWLPAEDRPMWLPTVHLAAISWSIGLLLLYELVEMAFAISKSVASSVTRHLQLYALVLLRDAFLGLDSLPEPIKVDYDQLPNVAVMASDAAGSILVFVAAALFARLQRHTPITSDTSGAETFVTVKRVIVIFLILLLVGLSMFRIAGIAGLPDTLPVLETYFTVLVFVDVLLAFVSLAFATNPAIVFRNFGFAFSAILLRFAIASPEFIRPGLGVAGALTAIAVTMAYNLAIDGRIRPAPEDKLVRSAGVIEDQGATDTA